MRVSACAAVLVASTLAMSACGSSRGSSTTDAGAGTDAIQLHETGYDALPPPLRNFVRSLVASPTEGPIAEIDAYGPGSRAALVKASSGDVVVESAREQHERFYLVVLHGHFVCSACSGPAGARPPHGTIETRVWSPAEGGTDFGISSSLPAAVPRLHRLATIQLS